MEEDVDDDENFIYLTMHDLTVRFLKTDFIIVMIASVLYYVVGVNYYHFSAGFSVLDAALFSVASLTTVGFSDEPLLSEHDRIFTCFFLLFGVSICGTAVSILVSQVVESYQTKQKKRQKKFVKKVTDIRRSFQSDSMESNPLHGSRPPSFVDRDSLMPKSMVSLGSRIQEDITLDQYIQLSKLQSKSILSKLRIEALINCGVIMFLIAVGALGFYFAEDKSILDSVYWAVDYLTTVSSTASFLW
jgi:hypothetical protein